MRAVLEFLMIAEVKTLAQALEVVTDVAHPAGGVLVDALHLARCGAAAADVASIARDRLPYAQLCDGYATLSNPDYDTYLADAIDGRCAAGEGEDSIGPGPRGLQELVLVDPHLLQYEPPRLPRGRVAPVDLAGLV